MEQKNLTMPVTVNETVLKETAEIPVDTEYTLPDYCPEISKILKCKTDVFIISKGINGKNVTVDGNVLITLIYVSGEGELYSYEYQYPFNKTFEGADGIENAYVFAAAKTDYINCRAVSPRKVDVHGAISLCVNAQKKKTVEIISDIDDDTIELKRSVISASSPIGYAEKYVNIEEETEIGQSSDAVKCVLRYEGNARVKECKLLPNKVMLKGELCVKIVYATVTGKQQHLNTVIPFSQLLGIEGINESCKSDSDCKLCYLEVKPSSFEESKSFTINAKVLVCCKTYCENDIEVITDAFSRKFETEFKKNSIRLSKLCCELCDRMQIKDTAEVKDIKICSVCDMWYYSVIENHSIENGELKLSGFINACIIADCEDEDPCVIEKKIPFEYSKKLENNSDNLYCEPTVNVLSGSYIIASESCIELRFELEIKAAVYTDNTDAVLIGVNINSSKPVEKNSRGAMTVYFASKNENIWNIAKKYCASVKEIMRINDLTEETIENDRMILVPMI